MPSSTALSSSPSTVQLRNIYLWPSAPFLSRRYAVDNSLLCFKCKWNQGNKTSTKVAVYDIKSAPIFHILHPTERVTIKSQKKKATKKVFTPFVEASTTMNTFACWYWDCLLSCSLVSCTLSFTLIAVGFVSSASSSHRLFLRTTLLNCYNSYNCCTVSSLKSLIGSYILTIYFLRL